MANTCAILCARVFRPGPTSPKGTSSAEFGSRGPFKVTYGLSRAFHISDRFVIATGLPQCSNTEDLCGCVACAQVSYEHPIVLKLKTFFGRVWGTLFIFQVSFLKCVSLFFVEGLILGSTICQKNPQARPEKVRRGTKFFSKIP